MIVEAEQLIEKYLEWLRKEISVRQRGHTVQITAPFLDRHNDYIQFYAERDNNGLLLTDRGYTITDLEMSGCKLNTPKRKELLKMTLSGLGVKLQDGELRVSASESDFGRKKHRLLQAMLAVNDMFYLASSSARSLYHEDVVAWLDDAEIRYTPGVKLSGKTGYDHHYDFVIPKSASHPERVLLSINNPNRSSAERTVFAWEDTKGERRGDSRAYAMLNDSQRSLSQSILDALRNYDVRPVLWSQRETVLEELAA